MKRKLCTLLALAMLAGAADATVIGVGPAKIEFKDAARGASYVDHLAASTTDKELLCRLSASGQIKDWVSFEKTEFKLTDGVQYRFPVRVTVPESTPNGVYSGIIELSSQPPRSGKESMGVGVGAAVYVNTIVYVGGAEGAWLRVLRVSASNAREGNPINAEVTVKNNAAKEIRPKITFTVLSRDRRKTYATIVKSDYVIPPLTRDVLSAQLSSTDMPPSIYFMEFKVEDDNRLVWQGQETFYVIALDAKAEPSTLRVEGVLDDALITNANMSLGDFAQAKAVFKNTGEVPLDAKMRVDFIKDGNTVQQETINEYVDTGEEKLFTLKYKPPETGQYRVRIWVDYSGFRTAVRETNMIVWSYTRPLNLDVNFYLIALLAAILTLTWLVFYYKKYYADQS